MALPEDFVFTPGPPPSTRAFGLLFSDRDQEQRYQAWRLDHVRPFVRFAMYSATVAAVCAWPAVVLGALVELRGTALALITFEVAILLVGAAQARGDAWGPGLMRWSWLVNFVGGFLALLLTVPLENITATAACVAMAAYYGLTMFRLPPLLALASVGPYMLGTMVLATRWYADGVIDRNRLVLGLFVVGTTLVTGMVVNLALEWLTRQTYLDHLLIQEQQEALFEDRTQMARFLSPEVSAAIHDRGLQAAVRTEMLSLTAVSIDLRGFTAYTQAHGATRMAQVLREYYEAVVEAAREFGATVNDFAGDGAMVLVGAPIQRADHPRAGLELARAMLARVRVITDACSTPQTPLGAGVGIASGECAVGPIGSLLQLQYTAVGHPPNLAARLCDVAEDGQILMAPGTARALEDAPGWRRRVVTLSGIPEPVEVTIEDVRRTPVVRLRPTTDSGGHVPV